MIDKKIISETISELLSANVDKETIFSTLRDIGAEEGDIIEAYDALSNGKKEQIPQKKEQDIQPAPEKKDIKKISIDDEFINPKKGNITEIDKQDIELKSTTKAVETINSSHDSYSQEIKPSIESGNNKIIFDQLAELDSKIGEIKAQINGLTKIMKDILEESRNILSKLS